MLLEQRFCRTLVNRCVREFTIYFFRGKMNFIYLFILIKNDLFPPFYSLK